MLAYIILFLGILSVLPSVEGKHRSPFYQLDPIFREHSRKSRPNKYLWWAGTEYRGMLPLTIFEINFCSTFLGCFDDSREYRVTGDIQHSRSSNYCNYTLTASQSLEIKSLELSCFIICTLATLVYPSKQYYSCNSITRDKSPRYVSPQS